MIKWMLPILILSTMTIVSCKSDESDDLAKAQNCLDNVPDSNPAKADSCLEFVAKYDSQQANILKCSIYITSGGLVGSKIVSAYNALKTTSFASPSGTFLAVLGLNVPDKTAGLAKAQIAKPYCDLTGIPSYKTFSAYILAGSIMNNLIPGVTDPTSAQGQIDLTNALTACAATPGGAGCEPASIGTAVITIADSYCSTASADEKICKDIDDALSQSDGTPADVGAALYCYLNGQSYATGTCL